MKAEIGEKCKAQFLQASLLYVIIFTPYFSNIMFFFNKCLLKRPLKPHMTLYLMFF